MELKEIYTRNFPARGYTALTVWPWVFIREDCRQKYTSTAKRHELTHACQQKECLLLPFFLWYALEWAVKLLVCRLDADRAYRSISFEQEAYANQAGVEYNRERRHFAWVKYVFRLWKVTTI